jgi:hypothetical protein
MSSIACLYIELYYTVNSRNNNMGGQNQDKIVTHNNQIDTDAL